MRVVIIANPAASAYTDSLVAELIPLCERHADVTLYQTAGPDHATKLAESSSDGATIMLSVGGDGTAREVVHGLVDSPRTSPMFIVPAGARVRLVADLLEVKRHAHGFTEAILAVALEIEDQTRPAYTANTRLLYREVDPCES